MAPSLFVLGLVVLTSTGAYAVGRRRLRAAGFRPALGAALECLGLGTVFYAFNVATGIGLALLLRAVGGPFISSYWSADVSLLALSLVQAIVFLAWRGRI